jgi:hypothetical protein
MVVVKLAKPAREKFRVVTAGEDVFNVIDPDGIKYAVYDNLCAARACAAHQNAKADRAAKRQVRACMCCTKPFASEGIHNRLCDGCRTGERRVHAEDRRRA